ncbi:MAG: sigma-70 family RNA polymerase sigma factor [Myxococcota bacterium]
MDRETSDIIKQVRAGDVDAYAHIVRRYQGEVWRVVAWSLQDVEATKDLTQQAFVNAYLNLDSVREDADFGVWLRTIARNVVRNELRRRSREGVRMRHYHQWLLQRFENAQESEQFERERAEALRRCRERLAPTAAQALEMRYEQGMDFGRIAQELDRTVAAARQMLQRVRATLRQCMDQGRVA